MFSNEPIPFRATSINHGSSRVRLSCDNGSNDEVWVGTFRSCDCPHDMKGIVKVSALTMKNNWNNGLKIRHTFVEFFDKFFRSIIFDVTIEIENIRFMFEKVFMLVTSGD